MLHWLFAYYAAWVVSYVYVAIAAIVLFVPMVAAYMLGISGTKSTGGRLSGAELRILLGAMMLVGLALGHLVLVLVAGVAVRYTSSGSAGFFVELLVGPREYDANRLLTYGGYVLAAWAIGAGGTWALIRDGGPLREKINELRNPSRERAAYGSAAFCEWFDFLRLQEPKESGLWLQGAFYGKHSRQDKKFCRLDTDILRGGNGKGICLSVEDQARGMIVFGPPGCGKSQAVILPIAADTMALGHSLLMADPQGELTDHILEYAAVTGHQVIIHDPTNPSRPHYNIVEGVDQVDEAQAITRVILGGGGSDEAFWQQSAANLLAACVLRFDTLGEILLALGDMRKLSEKLGEIPGDGASLLAASFIASAKTDGKVAGSILATVQASPISAWAGEPVREATDRCDFSAADLVSSPTVIILRCPARYNEVYGPYLGAILRRMMIDLDTIGEQAGGVVPRPVKIVLDEFPMLGHLQAVVRAVNIFRKRHIGFVLAAQTVAQLELIYGRDGANTLVNGLATQLVYGSCDTTTAVYVQHMVGRTTEAAVDKEHPDAPGYGRDLLGVEEVVRPAKGNSTLIYRYGTATYATQVVILTQLTRMYERTDWPKAIVAAKEQGREPLVLVGSVISREDRRKVADRDVVVAEADEVPVASEPESNGLEQPAAPVGSAVVGPQVAVDDKPAVPRRKSFDFGDAR